MSNISVKPTQPMVPVSAPKQAPAQAQPAAQAPQKSAMANDVLQWKDVPSSTRVKTAITTTFKQNVIPYTIGGAIAAPLAGAALGAFVGAFAGTPGKGAIEGAKAMARFIPHGAAVGAAAAGVDAAVMGTAVGTAPDRQSAVTRVGAATAIIGLLTAEDAMDVIGTGVGTVAESARAGRIFDKTEAALQKK
ncbi:MAG: hypothetical protein ACO1RX_21890 [Candidatus Sericytochromatia bacterium]